MANLKSSIKKIRVDKRRTALNIAWEAKLAKAKKAGNLSEIYKAADKMAKKHIIAPRKAARIKAHAAHAQS